MPNNFQQGTKEWYDYEADKLGQYLEDPRLKEFILKTVQEALSVRFFGGPTPLRALIKEMIRLEIDAEEQ